MGYRGYGLPMFDLISEGNLGLIQAIRKFDPEKVLDLRLMQFGGLGINPRICFTQLVASKIGTTAAQKTFF